MNNGCRFNYFLPSRRFGSNSKKIEHQCRCPAHAGGYFLFCPDEYFYQNRHSLTGDGNCLFQMRYILPDLFCWNETHRHFHERFKLWAFIFTRSGRNLCTLSLFHNHYPYVAGDRCNHSVSIPDFYDYPGTIYPEWKSKAGNLVVFPYFIFRSFCDERIRHHNRCRFSDYRYCVINTFRICLHHHKGIEK